MDFPTTLNRKLVRNSSDVSALTASFGLHDNNVNGTGHAVMQFHVTDLELIAIKSETYTSLRDLLPAITSSSPSITSPTHNSSWQELPIKNPLVKQAAMSYLQPMSSTPPESGEEGLLGRLRGMCECFSWLNDVVLSRVRRVLGGRHKEEEDEEDREKYQ